MRVDWHILEDKIALPALLWMTESLTCSSLRRCGTATSVLAKMLQLLYLLLFLSLLLLIDKGQAQILWLGPVCDGPSPSVQQNERATPSMGGETF